MKFQYYMLFMCLICLIIPAFTIEQSKQLISKNQPTQSQQNVAPGTEQTDNRKPALQVAQSVKQIKQSFGDISGYLKSQSVFIDQLTKITNQKGQAIQQYNKRITLMNGLLKRLTQKVVQLRNFTSRIKQGYNELIQGIVGDYYYIVGLFFNFDNVMVIMVSVMLVNLIQDEDKGKGYRKICQNNNNQSAGQIIQEIQQHREIDGSISD